MKYQIAEYTIDPARYRISCGDAALPAEPKVFDLLVYLIRHRDRVLSREELFREVWEGREVSDATLSNHVMSARKILGDSGELQATIQTIRGRGYQFIAPVREIEDEVAAPEAGTMPAQRPAWRLPIGIALVVLVAGALFGWKYIAPSGTAGFRIALRARGSFRCLGRRARDVAALRGPGHAPGDP
jgi:DNA-binding winged helix-turn-helix (wHTH) protein